MLFQLCLNSWAVPSYHVARYMTCFTWKALDVLHVIRTRLRLGHLRVRVGDSKETVKISICAFECDCYVVIVVMEFPSDEREEARCGKPLVLQVDKRKYEHARCSFFAYLPTSVYSYLDNMDYLCHRKLRMGRSGDGGWEVCDDYEYRPIKPCIVYSFGSVDWTTDHALLVLILFSCLLACLLTCLLACLVD